MLRSVQACVGDVRTKATKGVRINADILVACWLPSQPPAACVYMLDRSMLPPRLHHLLLYTHPSTPAWHIHAPNAHAPQLPYASRARAVQIVPPARTPNGRRAARSGTPNRRAATTAISYTEQQSRRVARACGTATVWGEHAVGKSCEHAATQLCSSAALLCPAMPPMLG